MSQNLSPEQLNQIELSKTCPVLSTSSIRDGEIEIAAVPCLGKQCAWWMQINENFGKCSIAASCEISTINEINKEQQHGS